MSVITWYLYLLKDQQTKRLYTGITTDIKRRLAQHQSGKGAKCLRGMHPLTLVYLCHVGEHSLALRLEYKIKRLTKQKKEWLCHHCHDVLMLQHYLQLE